MQSALVALFAAVGWYASLGAGTAWFLAWVAPAPLLVLALRSRSRWRAFGLVFTAYAFGNVDLFRLYGGVAPTLVISAVVGLSAAAYTGCVWLFRRANAVLRPELAALVFPAWWTTFELVQCLASVNGTAGSVAYSQSGVLPIAQIASVTGWAGLTFLVTWVPAALAAAYVHARQRVLVAPGLALAFTLGFGAWRLSAEPAGEPLVVGLVSLDRAEGFRGDDAQVQATLAAYRDQVAALAARGAQLVLLPEEIVTWTAPEGPTLAHPGVEVIVGVDDRSGPRRNVAHWFAADGGRVATYQKRHLVPGFEADATPGDALVVRGGRGLAICKDLDFPALSRQYARAGARLLFVPAWDFGADGPIHAKMAMLRGIESGFAVVRAAREGRLTATDDRGRVWVDVSSADPGQALVTVRPGGGATIYARIGEVFAAGCVALALGLLVAARRARRIA